MELKHKRGKNVYIYKGFQNFTGKSPYMLIVMTDGEPDLYDWDGSDISVQELKRYYKETDQRDVLPIRYSEIL